MKRGRRIRFVADFLLFFHINVSLSSLNLTSSITQIHVSPTHWLLGYWTTTTTTTTTTKLQKLCSVLRRIKSTPWSKVLLEKLIVSQLVRKFPGFSGRFITVITKAFIWTYWIYSTKPTPQFSTNNSNILPSTLRFPSYVFLSVSRQKFSTFSHSPMHRPFHPIWLYCPNVSFHCSTIQGLGPLTCLVSDLTSESKNPYEIFS
jgi:hypothetical protein